MKLGFRSSLKSGRYIQTTPTRYIFPDLQRTTGGKKDDLEKIMDKKPMVDGLIEKVGKLKVKAKTQDTQKEMVKSQAEYVKKLRRKPKSKISLSF